MSEGKLEGLEENIKENCWNNRCYSMNIVDKVVDIKNKVAAYIVDVHYDTERAGIEISRKVVIFRPRTVGEKLVPVHRVWSFLVVSDKHEESRDNYFEKIETLQIAENNVVTVEVASKKKCVLLTTRLPLQTTEKEYEWERIIHFIIDADQVGTIFEEEKHFSLQEWRSELERLAKVLAEHLEFRLNAVQLYCGLGFFNKAKELSKKLPYPINLSDWKKYGTRGGKHNDMLIMGITGVLVNQNLI